MLNPKLAGAVAALCLYGLVTPALAGSRRGPEVIPGVGPMATSGDPAEASRRPEPGRYGGGLIEFLMTGSAGERRSMPPAGPARVVYGAPSAREQEDPGFGEPAPDAQAPAMPGYAMPRRAVDPAYQRQEVEFDGRQTPGTIVVDTENKFLYLVEDAGRALRYGIGVGRQGFLWRGQQVISRKAEWPDWTPPAEMVRRRPDLPAHMEGGIANPLGARAMYLGSSLYRIHGTNEPDTIGTNVSSGCIRLTNDDVTDLFGRVRVGTKVIVM